MVEDDGRVRRCFGHCVKVAELSVVEPTVKRVAAPTEVAYTRLKGFIQDSLAGVVAGYVESLKINEELGEIELRIKL